MGGYSRQSWSGPALSASPRGLARDEDLGIPSTGLLSQNFQGVVFKSVYFNRSVGSIALV